MICLIMFAPHATTLNPARAFTLLQTYRAVFSAVGHDDGRLDADVTRLGETTKQKMNEYGRNLCENPWYPNAAAPQPTTQSERETTTWSLSPMPLERAVALVSTM